MLTKLKPLAAMAMAAALLIGWARMARLKAENDILGGQVSALAQSNQSLASELAASQAALSAREAERARLSAESSELKCKLGEIYEKDTPAADWADTDCPDDVLECLRR